MSDRLLLTPWMSRSRLVAMTGLGLACLLSVPPLRAAEPAAKPTPDTAVGKDIAEQLRQAAKGNLSQKQLTVIVNGTEAKSTGITTIPKPAKPVAPTKPAGASKATAEAEPAEPAGPRLAVPARPHRSPDRPHRPDRNPEKRRPWP
jgi:hypothetical protein